MNYTLSMAGAGFRCAAAHCTENPMKVASGMIFLGNFILGLNPHGGMLWKVGAGICAAAHLSSILYGKGGEAVDPSVFKLSVKDFASSVGKMVCLPFGLLRPTHWRSVIASAKEYGVSGVARRCARGLMFWRYPFDTVLLGDFLAGACYVADCFATGGVVSRMGEAVAGGFVLLGAATGLVTKDGLQASRGFSAASLTSFGVGIATKTPALAAAGLVFIYSNYQISRVLSARQSAYTIKKPNYSL